VLGRWTEAKATLARSEPLSADDRQSWQDAIAATTSAGDGVPIEARRPVHLGWAAFACAMLLTGAAAWWLLQRGIDNPAQQRAPGQIAVANPIRDVDPASEFARLESGVKKLEAELAELEQQVERLDARRAIDEVLQQHRRLSE
jgi:hypothetical protein